MSSKAFGVFTWGPYVFDDVLNVKFEYKLVHPSAVPSGGASVFVPVLYTDSSYDLWSKVVALIRSSEGDSTIEVVPMPSSLELLMFGKTY